MKIYLLPFLTVIFLQISLLAQADSPRLKLASLDFAAPKGWIDVPVSSAMRKATWRTSGEPDAAEIAFFTFGKDQGGTVSENIQRWLGQFSESATKGESATISVNGRNVTFARSEGTYSSGMPGAGEPLPNYGLCGAIIESPEGLVFVKMIGPNPTVAALQKTFTEVVTNAAKSS